MFAWILNTNPLNSSCIGAIGPWSDARGRGEGMSSQNVSRNASSPKLLIALPKKRGDSSPASKRSRSKPSPASVEQLRVVAEPVVAVLSSASRSAGSSSPVTSTGGRSAPRPAEEPAWSSPNR